MTAATRIYKHSSVGTDWAALVLGAGLGLTLALQMTTVRASDFNSFYAVVVSVSQSATVVGPLGWLCDAMATAVMVGGQDSVAWFGQDELLEYQVFGVNRHEDTAWEI
jgi:thiamine biosynthesis lipoprotein